MDGKKQHTNVRALVSSSLVPAGAPAASPPLYNYNSDAGHGSANFAQDAGLSWRRALLGGVAAGAMWAGAPKQAQASLPVHANCTFPAPNVMLCQGDQGPGINVQNYEGIKVLNVNSLTANIAPASGVDGIFFRSSTTATLDSTFGGFNITTLGNNADGLDVNAPNGVTIVHSGDISTAGTGSAGIRAYSSYGNTGVASTGNIMTKGINANGIYARSGYAGVIVTSTGNIIVDGNEAAGIRAIGHGEDGGDGEDVTVTSTGNIAAKGNDANGIFAQNNDGDTTVTSTGNVIVGNNGVGISARSSNYGSASITSIGDLSVGSESVGILAQSNNGNTAVHSTGDINGGASSSGIVAMGGFGGKGGPALKPVPSGDIAVTSVGDITLTGENNSHGGFFGLSSAGILAYGEGGITIASTGDISTSGDNRSGIVAFSVGGFGCGLCGKAVSPGVSIVSVGNVTTTGNGSFGIIGVGFYGNVKISSTGDITTSGSNSTAIGAYSNGGELVVTSKGNIKTTGNFSDGIAASSRDGEVTVTNTGNITTAGERSNGIETHNDGHDGNITVNSTGDIKASGKNASGIVSFGGLTSTVNILGGTISGGSTDGMGAAAGVTFDRGSTNTLNNLGTITGGKSGWAVLGNSGSETVNNFGTITGNVDLVNGGNSGSKAAKEASPHAILVPSTNDFNNGEGGTFNSGDTVSLGTDGVLTNDGTLNPGGDGKVKTTSLLGRLVQSAKGIFGVDIDHKANTADRINVSEGATGTIFTKVGPEGSATLSGKVATNLLNFDMIKPDKNFTILSAAGGTTHAGLSVTDTALVDYSLLYPNSHDVVLAMNVSFRAAGLSENQSAVVDYFGRGVGAGMPPELEATYLALLNAKDADQLGAIVDQLYSNAGGGAALGGLQSGDALAKGLRSCPVAEGPYGQLRETSCIWAKPTVRRFTQGSDVDTPSIHDRTGGISGGFQAAVGANTWAGLGVSIEDSSTEINGTTKSDGTWWQIGGVAKWTQGPWKLSSSLSAGQGNIDTERGINIPGVSAIASSGTDVGLVTNMTRLAYSFGATGFYVTPMIDLGVSYINVDGYSETGAGALNLAVSSSSDWIVSGGPAVEIGSTITADGLTYRPYIKAGITFLSEDNFQTSARFASSPLSVAPFTIRSKFDDVFADFNAGVQMFGNNGLNLRLNYDGHYGENSRQHGLDAKLTINY